MAAGQGFKTFTTGEVLTAGDVNGYLMQGVLVFASAAARNAAITSPQEGQFAFTKDTNGLWYYDGAAWVASGATGDIEGVTAGVGITGGGTSGTVTITNDMATTITASGDIVVGTGSGTYDNLPIGTTGQLLTADTTVSPYKVKWATPAGGGKVLQVVQDTLTSNFSTGSSSSVDTGLTVSITPSSASSKIYITANAASWTVGGTSSPNNYSQFALMRDATQLQLNIIGHYNGYSTSGAEDFAPLSFSYLDSPATTSSVTYKIQGKIGVSSLARIDAGATQIASIVVMEIGA
jgi:hypothetical protein